MIAFAPACSVDARRPVRAWLMVSLAVCFITVAGRPAGAHPALGEVIQHHVALRADAENLDLDVELLFMDMRAMAERRRMDGDRDWTITPAEAATYARAMAEQAAGQLALHIDGQPVDLLPLHDPRIDLRGADEVGPIAFSLRLFCFARTPAALRAGSTLTIVDRLWPSAPAFCSLTIEATDGVELHGGPGGGLFAPLAGTAARCLRAECVRAPDRAPVSGPPAASTPASLGSSLMGGPAGTASGSAWPWLLPGAIIGIFALLRRRTCLPAMRPPGVGNMPYRMLWAALFTAGTMPALPRAEAQPAGAREMLDQLTSEHAYLFPEEERRVLDRLNRRFREADSRARREQSPQVREEMQKLSEELLAALDQSKQLRRVRLEGEEIAPNLAGIVEMPGEAGVMLLRIDDGAGPARLVTLNVDFSQIRWERALVEVQIGSGGTTWAVVGLRNLPAGRTHTSLRFTRSDGRMLHWPVELVTAAKARLKLTVLDEDGRPTPAMMRLTWRTGGRLDVRPTNAIDIGPQFDAQGDPSSRRGTNLPGDLAGSFWCVPGPLDMTLSPGEYHLAVRRGIEHVPFEEVFTAGPGELVERTVTIRRWVDMRKHGWYSGDDHVHNRILSDDDARRLMAWVKAEDVHLANVVKMGDIYRTWFEQRGFGKDYRVIDGDTILSPGQECPRTHQQIGHTLSMNLTSMVRDTDRYYSYDWVADTVHAQGGLFGYAHVNVDMFFVHRDMAMNVPAGRIDFVELLQFATLGTGLYYDFLNLGYKVTASAGSDVPWGGTVGEVRVYARVDEKDFSADAWFEAVRKGRTFVSNGPMLELFVEDALPGDQITVTSDRKLKVRARTWGDPRRMLPLRLDLIVHGDVAKSAKGEPGQKEVAVELELNAGHGFWIAAAAEGGDGTKAHTTPVYVIREGLRFWKFDAAEALISKSQRYLDEVEQIVREAREAAERGGVRTKEAGDDRAVRQLALQGDALRERAKKARQVFEELRRTLDEERPRRAAK